MNLNPSTTEYATDDKRWLGSEHGTTSCESITLDPALMLAVFADGNVPSGVVLGQVTATERYGPYDDAATDGREVARGHLFDTVKVTAGQNTGAALYWHGRVRTTNLPTNHGLDAAAQADLNQIRYV